jgi:hypothetical protein
VHNVPVYSFDLKTNPVIQRLQAECPEWKFQQGDTLSGLEIPTCDLIFFDSLHTFTQLKRELALYGQKSLKYLVFHDTITFGIQAADGETGQYKDGWVRGKFYPEVHGIRLAIDEFQIEHPEWKIIYHSPESHGLLVLQR